ncbi:MAG TPA: alpha/beta fold hydrolase [Polyangiales bacterium]|nr:alpha/beta fold hydrolase [Polyangiales bacterium]
MPFAQASSATIHYTVEGAGEETILLVMGLGGHAAEWGQAFVADLARDHRVVRMDNRGIAQSQTSAQTWTMSDMADDARAVLDALGLARVYVVGTSMGGMVAQLLAAEHASRVSKLVLMSTSFGGRDSVPPTDKGAAAFGPLPGATVGEQRRRGLRMLTSDGFADDHPDLIDMLVSQRERNPTSLPTFKAQFEAIMNSDRSQLVEKIKAPTLVIHGDLDPLIPPKNGLLLSQRIAGARFELIEGCGHLPHLEKSVETAALIRDFFAAP